MGNLRNIRDLDTAELPPEVRRQIDNFVRRGHDPQHLVVSSDGEVCFDSELALNDAFDEIIYYPRMDAD